MEEKQSEEVPMTMDLAKSDSEVEKNGNKSPSHADEVGDEDSVAVGNSTDIPTTSVVGEETQSTEKSEEVVSANLTPSCNVEIEEHISSRIVINRSECENNTGSEVSMEIEATENQINNVFSSPRKESLRKQSLSEISSSTPNKATESSSVITNSPGDFPVEVKISDDEDDVVELPHGSEQTFQGSHRGTVVPYSDTDDSDSSSSSDSETSSDSSSSDCEDNLDGSISGNKSTCDSKSSDPKPVKVRGELDIEDLPPIQDLHISVRNDQVVEIGKVLHAVDTLVVVECYKDQPPLDIDSVLFLDRGARPLGRIFDVMGPVTEPLYCVRFNSKEHIEDQNIQPEMLVYSAPRTEHSQFVFVKHLMMMKGSDASWKKDKEVPGSELDFSDDEEEAKRRRDSNSRTEHIPNSWDEPKRKVSRPNQMESDGKFQPNARGFQGCPRGQTRENYRPRNPWGWSGARFNVPKNNYRNHSNTKFGQESAPGMFGNPPPSNNSSYSPSSEYSSYQHENDYTQENHYASASGNDYAPGNDYSQGLEYSNGNDYSHGQEAYPPHNTPDQRYQAFQSEIAKLVDAYNRGVDSPMTVASATYGMRPPGPQSQFGGSLGLRPPFGGRPFARRPPPPFGGRPPSTPHQFSATPPPGLTGPWTQFASRPSGPPPQFGSRPTGPPPQFGSRPTGPPPQFGSRPTGPPPQFGSRPTGPPPQFGSRPTRPPPQFGSRPTGPSSQFGSRPPAPTYDNQFY